MTDVRHSVTDRKSEMNIMSDNNTVRKDRGRGRRRGLYVQRVGTRMPRTMIIAASELPSGAKRRPSSRRRLASTSPRFDETTRERLAIGR